MEEIKTVIEKNKNLNVLRKKNAIGRQEIFKIQNKNCIDMTNQNDILQTIKTFYEELYNSYSCHGINSTKIPKIRNQGSEDILDISEDEIAPVLKQNAW